MDKNPDDDVIPIKMAELYESSNQLDKAAEIIQKALRNTPLPQTRATYAEIKEKQGDLKAATSSIEEAIKDAPAEDVFYKKANDIYKKAGDVNDFKVFVDGNKVSFDVPPKTQDSRTLVPVRALTEAMGADVQWDAATSTAIIKSEGKTIELTAGSKQAKVNGSPVTLDVPAKVEGGRVLVPLRFIGENLNRSVGYEGETKLISLSQ